MCSGIDLDAIKASGRNDAEHSAQLLLMHVWRERVCLQSELCAKFLRDQPGASSSEFASYVWRAFEEAQRRVRIPLFEASLP
jgi:hypothetical protein